FPSEGSVGLKAIFGLLQSMNNNMATNAGLTTLRQQITTETKLSISAAVDPLKDEMRELTDRVDYLEMQSSSSSGRTGKRQLALLSSLDISNRRVAFVGFEINDLASRVTQMKTYASTLSNVPPCTSEGHFFTGPSQIVSK
ncbi:unnamed protein product, partial [Prorocentrum cordatum]